MPVSPLQSDTDFITLDILIEGKELSSAYTVMYVEVDRVVNKIATAFFTLALSPEESEGKTFKLSESEEFVPGKKIEIKAGYDNKSSSIFEGIIMGHGLNIKGNNNILLEIECADSAIKMTNGHKNNYFKEKTDSKILAEIISNYGLKKKIDDASIIYPLVVQYQATDWDFLVTRAQAIGMIVNTQDGTLEIKKPVDEGSADLVLTFGKDVLSFQASFDGRNQTPAFKTSGWNAKTQEMEEADSAEPKFSQPGNFNAKKFGSGLKLTDASIHTSSPLGKDSLKQMANAHLLKSRLAMLQGKISFIGNAKPKINSLIELSGFGKRFNGDAIITGVHHKIEEGDWVTTINLGIDEEWFFQKANRSGTIANGLVPGIQGLHVGVVSKIHEDQDSAFRVLVLMPSIDQQKKELWARLSNLYATNGKGTFFYPEVNDEVIVGFLNNDPRFPVILGSLYNQKNKPPFTPDEKNKFKGIVSNSELKLCFNDEDKILSVHTPGKQEIILSDKDKSIVLKDMNGNTVELSESGISLDSAKDITITAGGSISLSAKSKIEAKASGGDIILDGLNVKAKAKMVFEATGAQSAKLVSTGQTVVQGGMVMIN